MTPKWEQLFDEEIDEDYLRGATTGKQLVGIKSFIKNLLAKEKKELLEEIHFEIAKIPYIEFKFSDVTKIIEDKLKSMDNFNE